MENYYFNNVDQAICWSFDVLRRRRFARISSVYQEMEQDPLDFEMAQNELTMVDCYLPTSAEDSLSLALKVQTLLSQSCMPDELFMLKLFYLGDYASEKRYQTALSMQEKLKEEGKRLRLSVRYSYRQLGAALNVEHKTAKRRLEKAQQKVSIHLKGNGFLGCDFSCVA